MPNVNIIETKDINDIFLDMDFIIDSQIIHISYQYMMYSTTVVLFFSMSAVLTLSIAERYFAGLPIEKFRYLWLHNANMPDHINPLGRVGTKTSNVILSLLDPRSISVFARPYMDLACDLADDNAFIVSVNGIYCNL